MKIKHALETNGWAIQFADGSFYNGLDSATKFERGFTTFVRYDERVRLSFESLRIFKTDSGAELQQSHLKDSGLTCEVIPVRTMIYPG